ncbi:MAG: M23 family metallopeptidase [Verrucomicrobia bacterium]|nr:M23 family metallopeptidase [Verrucomicrobiota bacterium]
MLNQLRFAATPSLGGFRGILFLCGLVCLCGGGLSCSTAARTYGAGSPGPAAEVTTRREGNLIHVQVDNSELGEVTLTFDVRPVNLKGSVAFPHTATFQPGPTEAFTLAPIQPDAPGHYSYTTYYRLGSSDAVHDDSVVYQLPYAPGRSYKVSQGYNSGFSHHGVERFAIDWKMPEGTEIRAARGGLVVRVKDDSNVGGRTIRFDPYNNFIIIRHADGTLGHYCHLKKDGVKVTPGQMVQAGDAIALSGNTGFSSGAHLHFCVYKTQDGRQRVTIPVKFADADGHAVTLVEGRRYRAPEIGGANVASKGAFSSTWVR